MSLRKTKPNTSPFALETIAWRLVTLIFSRFSYRIFIRKVTLFANVLTERCQEFLATWLNFGRFSDVRNNFASRFAQFNYNVRSTEREDRVAGHGKRKNIIHTLLILLLCKVCHFFFGIYLAHATSYCCKRKRISKHCCTHKRKHNVASSFLILLSLWVTNLTQRDLDWPIWVRRSHPRVAWFSSTCDQT